MLNGNKVVVVRCEELNLSGGFFRRKLDYMKFMRLRHLVKPSKGGPFHHRAPSRIFLKSVRGMIPHKLAKGAAAMQRIKVFEGVPPLYQSKKKMVVPQALRVLRLKPGRKYCTLKRLSSEFGWAHAEVVDKLEAKRKVSLIGYFDHLNYPLIPTHRLRVLLTTNVRLLLPSSVQTLSRMLHKTLSSLSSVTNCVYLKLFIT